MKNMNQETGEYSVNLREEDFTRYREKLKLATGEQLPDPYTLKEKWTNDISSLPKITWRDVTEYLLDTLSAYTKESIKAYKSLKLLATLSADMCKIATTTKYL